MARVLVVGSGAREHVLAWKLAQSSQISRLFVAPGNAGTAAFASNLPVDPRRSADLVEVVMTEGIGLVVAANDMHTSGLSEALAVSMTPTFGVFPATQLLGKLLRGVAGRQLPGLGYGSPGERNRTLSVTAVTDGVVVVPLASCESYGVSISTVGETMAMAAKSPAPVARRDWVQEVCWELLRPLVLKLADAGSPYRGMLHVDLLAAPDQSVVSRLRFGLGDPEAQAILTRLESDLCTLLMSAAVGHLTDQAVEMSNKSTMALVLTSRRPGTEFRSSPITITGDLDPDVLLFQHGVARDASGVVVTTGERVVTVVGLGTGDPEANDKAERNAGQIEFEGCHFLSITAAPSFGG